MNGFNKPAVFTNILSGSNVTSAISIHGMELLSAWLPIINSSQVFVWLGFNQSSESFTRLRSETNPSSDFFFEVAAGSRSAIIPEAAGGARYIKIQTGVNQTDTRTLVVMGKRLVI